MNFVIVTLLISSTIFAQTYTPFSTTSKGAEEKKEPTTYEDQDPSNIPLYTESVPKLPYNPFPGGCAMEGTGIELSKLSDQFIPFSLNEYIKEKKLEAQFRFFKTSDFKGQPAYFLNEKGLHKAGKLVCPWEIPYEEETKYKNRLSGCGYSFLTLANDAQNGIEMGRNCIVMEVDSYTISANDEYQYKFKINDEAYFLDVSNMPDLKNGKYLSSELSRAKKMSSIVYRNAELIKELHQNPSFQKLTKCFERKDFNCVDEFIQIKFTNQIMREYEICSTSGETVPCTDTKLPLCTPSLLKRVNFKAYEMVALFIRAINFYDVRSVSMFSNGEYLFEVSESFTVHLELKDGQLQFKFFSTHSVC